MGAATGTSVRRIAKTHRRLLSTKTEVKAVVPQSEPPSVPKYPFPIDEDALLHSLRRISTHPSLTPYRRLVYRTLLSVPRGRWTTYASLSTHLSSSARAIGNAMKTNPFAPEVPCHRVLATDRTIGGYKGKWGNGAEYSTEKTKLLKGEGVVFDDKGKAHGEVFRDFVDMGQLLGTRQEV
ncbi:6-O-methylguanine DNA methyltransferase [Emydomyces testavorans]|uniref:Methylated-DNA--protein-cysteine methyltransferase n=1 Tax=Emydomyces testavorans TaxID=2070801 RepID=A0AAF0DKM2_9EURO|nr:6-O-methylguanine DNA methyltransferase [Emydomyces testavorans]